MQVTRKLPLAAGFAAALLLGAAAQAKLPALSPEAKDKAAEAAAKTAWSDKVAAYQLCKSQDQTAAGYFKAAKTSGKTVAPATETPACADPGPFSYTPAGSAPAAAPAAPAAKK
ncbi:MAG TPA: hypothetical protein VN680_00410 [Burkholderiaceae bacterium]|jgi:hypothetical protein|nr:hypothetical protein [Burkholderiaceae bacterium]